MSTLMHDSVESDRLERTLFLLRELREAIAARQSQVVELRAQLAEANSEIDRHHADFKRISEILDQLDANVGSNWYTRQIRNIVG